MKTILQFLSASLLVVPAVVCAAEIKKGEMAGYLFGPAEKVPEEFNAGFSLYAAAWPVVETYPGHRFQTGLCATWMHPQYEAGKEPAGKCYTDVEGGLGWWRDTHFPTTTPNPITFGYRWDEQLTRKTGSLVTLPEYYRLDVDGKKPQWSVVSPKDVPPELGLTQYRFETPKEEPQEPRTTPDDPASCWKKPGPAAGPFKARLGDGSVATYYWYRFADQPAMLNADLTPEEREHVQKRVERLHRAWNKDRNYLAPPDVGKLAELDPALILTPPRGMEAGYVPIATRQELAGAASHPNDQEKARQ